MGGAVGKVISTVASFAGGPIGTIASMAFQGYSFLKQRSEGKKAAKAQSAQAQLMQKSEESKARYSQVQAQRERVAQQRQARIQQGRILGQMGTSGLGMTGSAPFTGAMGSVSSQLGANIGQINQGAGFAQEQSGYNIAAAQQGTQAGQAMASAGGWQQMATLAGNMSSGSFGNIFDIQPTTTSKSTTPSLLISK